MSVIKFHAAAYIRLSREDGDKAESDSIANQRKLIAEYLRGKEGLTLYDTYIDDGFTGTNFQRPAFQRMMEDIEAGRINCVIVKDLSRFGRDYIETGKYLERLFPDSGIRFISITDGIDSGKQAYDMLLPMKNIFNEQYARDISKKVRSSMEAKQRAGEFIGAFAPYGYRKSDDDKNRLAVDGYAAEIVRRIYRMYIGGCGKNGIAAALNREGIVCPSEYKRLKGWQYRNSRKLESTCYWTYSTVDRILRNELYAGNMVQGKKRQTMRGKQRAVPRDEWIVVENTHEALIDRDTWETAQELLKRRTREPDWKNHTTVFAGFLRCGDCGRALVRKNGKYYCGTYVRSGRQYCTPHAVMYALLESIVLNDLNDVLSAAGDLRGIAEKVCRESMRPRCRERERERLYAELEKIRRLKKAAYEDCRLGMLSEEEYRAYREDYMGRETLLTRQIALEKEAEAGEKSRDPCQAAWIRELLERGRAEELDRAVVLEMLKEIRVYENGRIKVIYRFAQE